MMATITQETHVALSGRESLALGNLRGQLIECRSGKLWITVDGEGRDVILGPGETYAVASNAPVVASAFKASEFTLRNH